MFVAAGCEGLQAGTVANTETGLASADEVTDGVIDLQINALALALPGTSAQPDASFLPAAPTLAEAVEHVALREVRTNINIAARELRCQGTGHTQVPRFNLNRKRECPAKP